MPRIELAAWHGGRAPGTEVEVTDDELRDLVRDGRVAKVLAPAALPQTTPAPDTVAAVAPDETPAQPLPEASETPAPAAASRRKGR
ncbi:hypothetical protein [Streptomyces anthocyanicus]|uniref:hypothetical protein n=1 Tax=Streptomyces anthocyanicus TaxID=68174 RepID=UPI0037FED188